MISMMASQISGLLTVSSTVCSGADQRKHQSSASVSFVRGIHRCPEDSPHKRPVTLKLFPLDDVIIIKTQSSRLTIARVPLIKMKQPSWVLIMVKTTPLHWIGPQWYIPCKKTYSGKIYWSSWTSSRASSAVISSSVDAAQSQATGPLFTKR